MKTFSSICGSVLICTLMFALGTEVVLAAPSVAVTNSLGSALFKLYYKSEGKKKVRVSIKDEHDKTVFREVISNLKSFIRPYNFEGLPEGNYTVVVEDESGKAVEKVAYKMNSVETLIHASKLAADPNKILLSVYSSQPEEVFIYIFDENGDLLHNEIQTVKKEFAQVYNFSGVKNFTIEVWNKGGELKKSLTF